MERPAKVSFSFLEDTPTQKGMFGDNIIAEMTEHSTVFLPPDVPIATITANNDLLKQKTQQAMSGDKVKIQERDEAEKEWDKNFRKEGEYVQRIASGNKLIIAQSGYKSTDTEVHPVQQPAQAQLDAWANKGRGSGIHAEIKPLADCRGFVFIISSQPVNAMAVVKGDLLKLRSDGLQLDLKLTTKRKVDFEELKSGQTYYISALGFNATGVGELANVVEVIAP